MEGEIRGAEQAAPFAKEVAPVFDEDGLNGSTAFSRHESETFFEGMERRAGESAGAFREDDEIFTLPDSGDGFADEFDSGVIRKKSARTGRAVKGRAAHQSGTHDAGGIRPLTQKKKGIEKSGMIRDENGPRGESRSGLQLVVHDEEVPSFRKAKKPIEEPGQLVPGFGPCVGGRTNG